MEVGVLNKRVNYWKEKLLGYQSLRLPADYAVAAEGEYDVADLKFNLSGDISGKLKELAQFHSVDLGDIILGGLAILLSKYSGQDDIVIGEMFYDEIDSSWDLFRRNLVNSRIARIWLNNTQNFTELIHLVKNDRTRDYAHLNFFIDEIDEELCAMPDNSIMPLLFRIKKGNKAPNSNLKSLDLIDQVHRPNLAIIIEENQEYLEGQVLFNSKLYKEDTIIRIVDHFSYLLEELLKLPEKPYSKIVLLRPDEFKTIICDWNSTDKVFVQNKTIHRLFEEQVEKTPNNTALVYENESVTYKELNESSNRLARYLQEQFKVRTSKKISSDTLIALCLDRGLEMVVGIIAVLKAGGAYVPIDPSYPQDRIDFILFDTKAELVITHQQLILDGKKELPKEKVVFIEFGEKFLPGQAKTNLPNQSSSKDLAYVIYTSGTTGKPKGVMVEHGAVLNTLISLSNVYESESVKKVTAFSSYVFDVSVSEIFNSLLIGLELHILPNTVRIDNHALSGYLIDNKINLAYLPPAILKQLKPKKYPDLKRIIYAGEVCDKQTVGLWSKKVELFNYYGPTETSIYITGKQLLAKEAEQIGKPIENSKVYILDKNKLPVPIGVIGELYIGGAGLARGYLNRPEITLELFGNNPFASDLDKKNGYTQLYKTGDLAKWLPDGNIGYIGRDDDQVKINGYRIELGEVENTLNSIEGVKNCCVLMKEDERDGIRNKYLVGYYVLEKNNLSLNNDLIWERLKLALPNYMVPSSLVQMESFPVTINGKLDKRAFPAPDFASGERYVAPVTKLEVIVGGIWQEVLGIKPIGINDNFFRLGGNSILAMEVIARINKQLKNNFKVTSLLKYPTIKEWLNNCSFKAEWEKEEIHLVGDRIHHFEQSIYNHDLSLSPSVVYNEGFVVEFFKPLRIKKLKETIKNLLAKYEVLNCNFQQDSEGQLIRTLNLDSNVIFEKLTVENPSGFALLLQELQQKPFDLSKDKLIRFYFITTGENQVLFITFHHIILDATSVTNIILPELYEDLYHEGFRIGTEGKINEFYKLTNLIGKHYENNIEEKLKFWKENLLPCEPIRMALRTKSFSSKGAQLNAVLDYTVRENVQFVSEKLNISVFNVLYGLFALVLSKFSGKNKFVISTNVDERIFAPAFKNIPGCFINNAFIINTLNSEDNVSTFLSKSSANVLTTLETLVPYSKLLSLDRELIQELGDVQFNIETQETHVYSYEHSQINSHSGEVKKGLYFELDVKEDKIFIRVEYRTDSYEKYIVESLFQSYINILNNVASLVHNKIGEISLLTAKEYDQVMLRWNRIEKEYPREKAIYKLFEEQAERLPNNTALVFEGKELSYKELNEKSNQLAHHIREEYKNKTNEMLGPDTLIVLCLDKSFEMVVGILAVLKAGGAYVPMDPNYPQERIDYILEDTNPVLILTQQNLSRISKLELPNDKLIFIDLDNEIYSRPTKTNLSIATQEGDLAYVIYTSGTTGKPKGVMVEHGNVARLFTCTEDRFGFNSNDVWTLFHSYVFDFSVWELWGALIYGGKLLVVPQEQTKDTEKFYQLCCSYKISVLNQTPSAFYRFVDIAIQSGQTGLGLRYVIFGGEALNAEQLVPWWAFQLSNKLSIRLINMYGITETTVHVTFKELSQNEIVESNIGKPIADLQCYVFDANKMLAPIGVVGELYVGGAGLARGYLNRADLTRERFLINPLATEKLSYKRLYKTGDLVRRLPDGNLEYIGRNDDQVKIRGYRIELGEIENAMLNIAGIKQSCVLAKERGSDSGSGKYLVGYYVANPNMGLLSQNIIMEKLIQVLPEYMVPSALLELESFPLTINGKLDKRALPQPEFSSIDKYVPPSSELEFICCNIWQEILRLDWVGVTDNFFKIGGDSILAIKASHQMSASLGFNVRVADIFKHKTISELLCHNINAKEIKIPKIHSNQGVLSFAQERLWFVEQYEEGTNAYHIPLIYRLDNEVDIMGVKRALQNIVSRHEVLRSTIGQGKNEQGGVQVVHYDEISIEEVIIDNAEDYKSIIKEEINRPFELNNEYPIRVKLYFIQSFEDVGDQVLLLVNLHHIAGDGWSVGIFEREFTYYYEAYIANAPELKLPILEIQYKDYAAWQRGYLSGGTLAIQLKYWKEKLDSYQILELPTDYVRPHTIDYRGTRQKISLNKKLSDKLKVLAHRTGTTLHSVMLSAFTILLNKYTGQEDVTVGIPIANRYLKQTEGLIGFFVNIQASRTHLCTNQSFLDLIQQVNKDQIEAQQHQDLPFEMLLNELGVERDESRHPIFQIMFSFDSFRNESSLLEKQRQYLKSIAIEDVYEVEKFDLSVEITDRNEDLICQVGYAICLFRNTTITRFINHYVQLLEELSDSPDTPYGQFSVLTKSEFNTQIYSWNSTDKEFPRDKTIHELFEDQVRKTPDNIALIFDGQELSYNELNEKSNQLARYIRRQYKERANREISADSLIGLCLERSIEMVLGILAVLKAGAAYVPIEPNYPPDRMDHILTDTNALLILCQRKVVEHYKIPLASEKLVYIDLPNSPFNGEEVINLSKYSCATDLAYVIYTSGTTGMPKGVLVEHRSIASKSNFYEQQYGVGPTQVSLFYRSYAFDGSIEEYLIPLLHGAKIVIYGAPVFDLDLFIDIVKDKRITKLNMPPQLLYKIIETDKEALDNLNVLISGGDVLDFSILNRYCYKCSVYNSYGPTECTIDTHIFKINYLDKSYKTGQSCIGKNVFDCKSYVLDKNLLPVPVGVTGELFIGGAGIARGYLNRVDLTLERFISNHFATEEDKRKGYTRLYKTGDLVKWLPDGNIEYIGRNDDQVKIRGYRIELEEIENVIMKIDGIKQACVIAKEGKKENGNNKFLIGYYILEPSATLNSVDILETLSCILPEYMIPSALQEMDSFPLTINGKLDKRALPDLEFVSEVKYECPQTENEKICCEIWQEVLGIERVGVTDDFFKLGGNSISAIQVSHHMSKTLKASIKVSDVFKLRSIKNLNDKILSAKLESENIRLVF